MLAGASSASELLLTMKCHGDLVEGLRWLLRVFSVRVSFVWTLSFDCDDVCLQDGWSFGNCLKSALVGVFGDCLPAVVC